MRIRIAIRNTFRNKRRTALNVFMIASGVASLILFKGFSANLILSIREGTIQFQYGHLQVARESLWKNSAENPNENLIPDYQGLLKRIQDVPSVKSATGWIGFYGLLGAKDRTVGAQLLSLDPVNESLRLSNLVMVEGKAANYTGGQKVLLGAGVASALRAKVGDNLNLLGYTYDGLVNALDVEVAGIFKSGLKEIDNVTAMIPLEVSQKLLDTKDVEKFIIYLKSTELTEDGRRAVSSLLDSGPRGLEIKPWYELAAFYKEVRSFYNLYDAVIQLIILSLVLIGILNTIGMSVFERTGEMGTMRALGETQRNIVRQFVLEGAVLGVFGGVVGAVAGAVLALVINAIDFRAPMPGASLPQRIQILLPIWNFVEALALTLAASMVAAVIPAVRAVKLEIVDALRRNI
ncbi:MAG: FtsX-like permease family protein [Oligoflexia bacterium]|nr:FtsX-like permease family protein [Oligoflexia bacterium]